MARLPRLDLPGIAQHVVPRGNNRIPCFLDDDDRPRYLHGLTEACIGSSERHAYVLMTNHAHLLLTPQARGALSRLMQTFGRNDARLCNARHKRSGTLWEGRFKSCLVETCGRDGMCPKMPSIVDCHGLRVNTSVRDHAPPLFAMRAAAPRSGWRGFAPRLLWLPLALALAACSSRNPGPLEGTWNVTEPFPVTVSFREGEAEVMGKVRKVTYIRYWDKVTVVHDNDTRYDYFIVDDDTLRSDSGTLRRVPGPAGS